jgi:hypothetical protein
MLIGLRDFDNVISLGSKLLLTVKEAYKQSVQALIGSSQTGFLVTCHFF